MQWATQQLPWLPVSYQMGVDEEQFCRAEIVTYGLKQACGLPTFSSVVGSWLLACAVSCDRPSALKYKPHRERS